MTTPIRPIIALAGDPGGARALAPVLTVLKQQGNRPIECLAYRQALDLWRAQGLDPLPPEDWEADQARRIAASALLLTATSVNGEDWERQAIALAREQGVPSLAVLDFWINYRPRFAGPGSTLILPDRIAVMDDTARRDMIAQGFPEDRLRVTGQPAFDALAGARAAFTPEHRSRLRAELGLAAEDRLVLYVSQPFAQIYGGFDGARAALGFDEDRVFALCRNALADIARRRGIGLLMAVRPHPRERSKDFPSAQEPGFRTVIWNRPDRLEAVQAADLVVGMNSALLLEAAWLGRPVVSVQPGLKGNDSLPSNRQGESLSVTSEEALLRGLEKGLLDDAWRQVRMMAIPPSGATGRVIVEIGKLLKGRRT